MLAKPATMPEQPSAMAAQPLITVRNLVKRYGRKPVLRGLELAVNPGQIVALLGPNGAGKTTLMRVISGLAKPDRGEILLGGATFQQAGHELRRYIGLVGHAPLLYDNLNGLENLHFFAAMYDIRTPDARIEWCLRTVGLWTRRRDPVRSYSRGMAQRLAIARAILHNPPVLLLDEPDTGLDQAGADLLHDLIHTLGASNRAILFSTHNLERALAWSDSICILQNGKIAYSAPAAALDLDQLHAAYAELHRE
ncbi:MAG: heme ABC exporter ATP-binding protein CcmA [Litorilinea sp.]